MPKYGVVCGVWCVVCGVLVSSEAGLCFASCSFVLPLAVCEVAHCCDLPWCGMWYVVWCWFRVKLAFAVPRLACPQQRLPMNTPPCY